MMISGLLSTKNYQKSMSGNGSYEMQNDPPPPTEGWAFLATSVTVTPASESWEMRCGLSQYELILHHADVI